MAEQTSLPAVLAVGSNASVCDAATGIAFASCTADFMTSAREDREAMAAEIVRRWNAHSDLVSALQDLLATHPVVNAPQYAPEWNFFRDKIEAARAAIAKAAG